jgi:cysteine synthase
MILSSVLQTVGRTPLVRLQRVGKNLPGQLLAKLESKNPGGSLKDRIGLAMVEDAERRGALKPGATLVEATSGNTGLALAFVAAAKGYRLIVTMPETMSSERISLLRYLGADVLLTPGKGLMRAATERAAEVLKEVPGSVMLDQFRNAANPEIHRQTTAMEIWESCGTELGAFVTGVGTGGTITGVGEVLKARHPSTHIVAVEPKKCAVLSGGRPGHHMIQGIGAGFIPPILNRDIIDEIIAVDEVDAFESARRLAKEEGISAGISSGAVLWAGLQVAARPQMQGRHVVVTVPDSGERYVTTQLMPDFS